jgi:hypothetical protein
MTYARNRTGQMFEIGQDYIDGMFGFAQIPLITGEIEILYPPRDSYESN